MHCRQGGLTWPALCFVLGLGASDPLELVCLRANLLDWNFGWNIFGRSSADSLNCVTYFLADSVVGLLRGAITMDIIPAKLVLRLGRPEVIRRKLRTAHPV